MILPSFNYLLASSIATATATVIPTMGLLPVSISHSNPSLFVLKRAILTAFLGFYPDYSAQNVFIRLCVSLSVSL